jgi:hypothetical protein
MLVTRAEEWCVEAENAEKARRLLAGGEAPASGASGQGRHPRYRRRHGRWQRGVGARILGRVVPPTAGAIASSLASGIKANFGTMTKGLHVGHCARNSLFAALLAERFHRQCRRVRA